MIRTRCSSHEGRHPRPACATCLRIMVEARIVRKTVRALLKAGFQLNVDNGGDCEELAHATDDRHALLAVLMDTDDEYLTVYRPGRDTRVGWVRFVYGNGGWDVISDYICHLPLEEAIQPVLDYASSLQV